LIKTSNISRVHFSLVVGITIYIKVFNRNNRVFSCNIGNLAGLISSVWVLRGPSKNDINLFFHHLDLLLCTSFIPLDSPNIILNAPFSHLPSAEYPPVVTFPCKAIPSTKLLSWCLYFSQKYAPIWVPTMMKRDFFFGFKWFVRSFFPLSTSYTYMYDLAGISPGCYFAQSRHLI